MEHDREMLDCKSVDGHGGMMSYVGKRVEENLGCRLLMQSL